MSQNFAGPKPLPLRRALAFCGLALLVVGYIGCAVTIGTTWVPAHWLAQSAFYALAGVLWVLPLRWTVFRKRN